MDTKKLVVGQKIWMRSGNLRKEATVTEITEHCIEAKPILFDENERPWLIRFQKDGKQYACLDGREPKKNPGKLGVYLWYEAEGFTGWWRDNPWPQCTEFGPWELVSKEEV